jgi:hypothetical protein
MLFVLSNAIFDAGIAAWDAKRTYDSVRPITAIPLLNKGKTIRAWGGPGKGTVEMDGAQWILTRRRPSPRLRFPITFLDTALIAPRRRGFFSCGPAATGLAIR